MSHSVPIDGRDSTQIDRVEQYGPDIDQLQPESVGCLGDQLAFADAWWSPEKTRRFCRDCCF
jgi:hypothetical protein